MILHSEILLIVRTSPEPSELPPSVRPPAQASRSAAWNSDPALVLGRPWPEPGPEVSSGDTKGDEGLWLGLSTAGLCSGEEVAGEEGIGPTSADPGRELWLLSASCCAMSV